MSCDEAFSFSNLEGTSFESEIGYSTLCASNKAKAAILFVNLAVYLGLFVLSGFLVYRGYTERRTVTPKIASDFFVFFSSVGE